MGKLMSEYLGVNDKTKVSGPINSISPLL